MFAQDPSDHSLQIARRTFLGRGAGIGLGSAALWSLMKGDGTLAAASKGHYQGLEGLPHFAAKAKRVIFLCMAGGPSHLETFDYKPKLAEMDGKPMPSSYTKGQPIAQAKSSSARAP